MLGLLGDEWNLLIIRQALLGATHYSQWHTALPISHAVLAHRLATLTEMALLERLKHQGRRPTYQLTPRGRETWPILLAMRAWETTWATPLPEAAPGPLAAPAVPGGAVHPARCNGTCGMGAAGKVCEAGEMVHLRCGMPLLPTLICAACGKTAGHRDTDGAFGPSGTWARSVPAATTRRRPAPSRTRAREPAATPGFGQTMQLIGNRWSAAVLGAAFQGLRRFGEFEQRLGAPPTVIADRLRVFVSLGVFEQVPGTDRPDWRTYRLTPKGLAFFPVMVTAIDWGQRWFQAAEGPALELRHRPCGGPFHARLACDACTAPLNLDEVAVTDSL
jgi:DNA-binding HxlR family transcriptional regulator